MLILPRFIEVYNFRNLIGSLVLSDLKVKYSSSQLGLIWLVLEPLLLVLTLSAIFSLQNRVSLGLDSTVPFPVFFYAGVLPWNFVRSSLTRGANCFVKDFKLYAKVPFPKEVSVYRCILRNFIELLLSSVAFFTLLAMFQIWPNYNWFYCIPLFFIQILFCCGLVFLLGTLNVFIRDIGTISNAMATLGFWATPIVFNFPFEGEMKYLYYANPMTGVIQGLREIVLFNNAPDFHHWVPGLIVSATLFLIGYFVFLKNEREFLDAL